MKRNKDYILGFTKIDIAKLDIAESNPETKVKITKKGNIITKEIRRPI